MLTDTDFWWHLAAGDAIRSTQSLPRFDMFSYTAGFYPWYNISWLWDVFYSWLNSLAPLYLPVVFTALINALTLAILANFLLQRQVNMVVVLLVILLAIPAYAYMLTPRPHEFTFLFLMIFYAICHHASSLKKYRSLQVLPPLMILWANIHGGFFVGFIIMGAYFLQALLAKDKKLVVMLMITISSCIIGCLLNPLGIDVFAACGRTLSSGLLPIISEWQSLAVDSRHVVHIIFIAVFVLTFRPRNKNLGLAEKLLSLLWLGAAVWHERNLPIFILLASPVMALNLQSLLTPTKIQPWLNRKDADYQRDLSQAKARKASFIISIAAIIFMLGGKGANWLNLDLPTHPVTEAEFIKQNFPNKLFLNDYFQGGYLLYAWRGHPQLFIDGRAETAYPAAVVKDYLDFHYGNPGWENMLNKYHIDGVVVPNDNQHVKFFESNRTWKKVYIGQEDVIYVRRI